MAAAGLDRIPTRFPSNGWCVEQTADINGEKEVPSSPSLSLSLYLSIYLHSTLLKKEKTHTRYGWNVGFEEVSPWMTPTNTQINTFCLSLYERV